MNSTKFNMTRDINGYNGFGIPFSLDGGTMLLAAGVAQTIQVPDNYPNWIAIFSYTPGSNIFVDGITTAVVPTGAYSASTARLNPSARFVTSTQELSFITSDVTSPLVSVEFLVVMPYGN